MRKRVQVRSVSEKNDALNIWFQHLINRIIVEQMDLPHHLKAKLIREASLLKKRGEKNE